MRGGRGLWWSPGIVGLALMSLAHVGAGGAGPFDAGATLRKSARGYRAPGKAYPYSSKRQAERYGRNRMDEQQRRSHPPGTLQPRHIFGG